MHFEIKLKKLLSAYIGSYCLKKGKVKNYKEHYLILGQYSI